VNISFAVAVRPDVYGLMHLSSRMPGSDPVVQLDELDVELSGNLVQTRNQPIVRLQDREPAALEALVRLNHPTHGILLPDVFLPLIETTGLAPKLTELVMRRAFGDLANLSLSTFDLAIALNVPLNVLLMPASIQMLDAERRNAGIAARQVIIELTESQPVEDFVALRDSVERLRASGYRVAIDDIAPSVPRLDELLELPFSDAKLDKDLVQQIATEPGALAFTVRLIEVAKRHGLTITAEGVEDAATWELLNDLGVDLVQGFFAARPLVAVAVPIWLRRWAKRRHFG
jgi:EAL domain-containing protein (putative c-di-GMP-specific phosphodiesterase class I)